MYCGKPLNEDNEHEIGHSKWGSPWVVDGYACEECNTMLEIIGEMEDTLEKTKECFKLRKGTYNVGL